MIRFRTTGYLATLIAAASLASPVGVWGQGVRGWVGSTVQMVEMRPLGLDTIARSQAIVDSLGNFTFEGRPVVCGSRSTCSGYRTLGEQQTFAATQDLYLTAFGFGVEGLSVTTLLRGRARFGGDLVWPRTDDEVDAMLAYAQLARSGMRMRFGRQELRTGLGFPGFDGLSANHTLGEVDLEAYGGRSLARGLREPINDALKGIEPFLPDESAYLFGAAAHARFYGTAVTARYHREIFADRSGLVSERAAIDVNTVLPGALVTASLDYDFAFAQFGKSHLTVSLPISEGTWLVEGSVRRYVPYFELSTIWGLFRPVAYHEIEMKTAWSGGTGLGVWGSLGWRKYGDAEATTVFRPLEDNGWRGDVGARWSPATGWVAQASYRLDWGPGGFLSSLDASGRYQASDKLGVTASLMSFQQIEEFRVGDGRAYGAGGSFDLTLTDRTQIGGGVSMLKHRDGGTVFDSPWNQARGWTSVRVGIGGDPGLSVRGRR